MKTTKILLQAVAFAIIALMVNACQPNQQVQEKKVEHMAKVNKAICVLHPTEGDSVHGTVTFTKTDEGIKIEADVHGLTPGKHGFHIHQWGNVSSLDGKSAGGHFNPDNKKHGGPHDAERHVGDFGNLEADESGHATLTMIDTVISFHGTHNIIGRGIIVHAGEDDLTSQPTGDAGARVAYGVIGIAGEEK